MLELISTLFLTPLPWRHRAADPCPVVLARRVRYGTVQAPRCGCGLPPSTPPASSSSGGGCSRPGAFCRPRRLIRSQLGTRAPSGHLNIQQFSLLPLGLLRGIWRAHIATDPLWHSAGLLSQHYKYFVSNHPPHPARSSALITRTPPPRFSIPASLLLQPPPLESICRLGPGTPR